MGNRIIDIDIVKYLPWINLCYQTDIQAMNKAVEIKTSRGYFVSLSNIIQSFDQIRFRLKNGEELVKYKYRMCKRKKKI